MSNLKLFGKTPSGENIIINMEDIRWICDGSKDGKTCLVEFLNGEQIWLATRVEEILKVLQ